MLPFSCFMVITVFMSSASLISGDAAAIGTNETDVEAQTELNVTDAQEPEDEVTEEATEVEVVEEATEDEGTTESETTEAGTTEAVTPVRNVTRTQAFREWSRSVLASKYFGSLAVLYLALCIFLAISQGPLFVH